MGRKQLIRAGWILIFVGFFLFWTPWWQVQAGALVAGAVGFLIEVLVFIWYGAEGFR